LATCPYRYFLRYALGIERPADRPLDPGTWLDAIEMGGLMHDIYRTYYQRLTATGPVKVQNRHPARAPSPLRPFAHRLLCGRRRCQGLLQM
ncbi:MAG: PD-(D/E)XK nuclease family protein, partial [Firmicutes bacterium]|nr:PD-(D/E)XK nuclease family protein [Bacillota bacterium]